MDVKADFEVTEKAGDWVAGRRSPGAGKTLLLTEAEAHHALMAGELKVPGSTPKRKPRKPAPQTTPEAGEA